MIGRESNSWLHFRRIFTTCQDDLLTVDRTVYPVKIYRTPWSLTRPHNYGRRWRWLSKNLPLSVSGGRNFFSTLVAHDGAYKNGRADTKRGSNSRLAGGVLPQNPQIPKTARRIWSEFKIYTHRISGRARYTFDKKNDDGFSKNGGRKFGVGHFCFTGLRLLWKSFFCVIRPPFWGDMRD